MASNNWAHQQPSKFIVIKELPSAFTEPRLASKLNALQANFDDIRIIPAQGPPGTIQAFIEFISVAAAKEWMESQKGTINLDGTHDRVMVYSQAPPASIAVPQQAEPMWECICGAFNVERRVLCFKCGNPQPSTSDNSAAKAGPYPAPERAYPPRERFDPYSRREEPYREIDGPYRGMEGPSRERDGPYGERDGPYWEREGPYRPMDGPYRQRDDPYRERDMYRSRGDPYLEPMRREPYGGPEERLHPGADPYRGGPPRMRDDGYGDRWEMARPNPYDRVDGGAERMSRPQVNTSDERDPSGRPLPVTRPEVDGRYKASNQVGDEMSDKNQFTTPSGRQGPSRAPGAARNLTDKSNVANVAYPGVGARAVSPRRQSTTRKMDDGYPVRGVSPPAARDADEISQKTKYPVFAPNTAALAGRNDKNKNSMQRRGDSSSANGYTSRDTDRDGPRKGAGDRPRDRRGDRHEDRLEDRHVDEPRDRLAPVEDGSDQLGPNPCNTVLLRGLDGLSDENRILDSLADVTSLGPTNCYVMRNLKTNVSLGYAFMEFDSIANGKKVVDYFNSQQSFEVDGKLLLVDFAKNTFKTIMAGIQVVRDKYAAEKVAAAEADKRKIFAAEQQAKIKEIELERQKMERRDLEIKQQQEMERKKAEEREKEVLRINQEREAKEKEEKDKFNAKFGVEAYTGYTYEQDTGLYTEEGKFIPERCCFVGHSMANNLDLRIFDEKEIVPNGKLDDLVTAALSLFESPTLKPYRVCCYLFFGITDLLDVKQASGYREVVLRSGGDALLLSKIDWAVRTLKQRGAMVVLCTFPPMSFQKHNQFLLKNGLTGKLECKSEYQAMQQKHNEQVCNINRKIEELNCDSGVVTCQLSAKLFVQERGRYILKDVYLRDGLHPTSQGAILLNVELAQNLRKSKQGKRSPEWLKKSHQVKSGSKISFGIKLKKDEPTLSSLSKISESFESKQNASAVAVAEKPAGERRYYQVMPSRSPRRTSLSPRRRSRSPRRRSRSPRRRSRSPRRRSRTPRRRSRSPRRRSRSPRRRSPRHHRMSDDDKNKREHIPSGVPEPVYKAVPVPKPLPLPEEESEQILPKQLGSFTLSGLLGALASQKENDSESNASMSMSPPGPEPDPDIVVVDTDAVAKKKSLSPSHRYSRNDYNHRRASSRSRQRYSRSYRRSRSRSRSRRRSEDRFESKSSYYPRSDPSSKSSRNWEKPTNERSGREQKAAKFESRFSDQPPSLPAGVKPSSFLDDRPKIDAEGLNDDHLVKLAEEHHELTGSNSFEQLKTLSHLNQLSSGKETGALAQALELQKLALAQKISGSIEQEKDKINKIIEAEKRKKNLDIDKILNSWKVPSGTGPDYGYGHAAQFQSGLSQFPGTDEWGNFNRAGSSYDVYNNMNPSGGGDNRFADAYGARYNESRSRGRMSLNHRDGYGGYE